MAAQHLGVACDKCLQLSVGTPAAPASLAAPAQPSRLERLVRLLFLFLFVPSLFSF